MQDAMAGGGSVAELREALAISRRDHQPTDPYQAKQADRQALRADPHAGASFQRAPELKPEDAEAQNNLGISLAQQGRLDESAACFQQALRLKPDYPDAHNNLGNILEKQNKLDEAVACYHQALRLRPADPEAHNNLGLALARQDKLDEAVASYQEALRLKPNYPEAHSNLGDRPRISPTPALDLFFPTLIDRSPCV